MDPSDAAHGGMKCSLGDCNHRIHYTCHAILVTRNDTPDRLLERRVAAAIQGDQDFSMCRCRWCGQ